MTREEAVSIASVVYPISVDTAAELMVALSDEDEGVRSCAANALAALPQPEVPEPTPLANADTLRARLRRSHGRAFAMACALSELRVWAGPLADPELDRLLGEVHGRLLAKTVAGRTAIIKLKGNRR